MMIIAFFFFLQECDDVYFDCEIQSTARVQQKIWRINIWFVDKIFFFTISFILSNKQIYIFDMKWVIYIFFFNLSLITNSLTKGSVIKSIN